MGIEIVTRAGKGSPLNATEFDANIVNLAAAVENVDTGHDHDGADSKKATKENILGLEASSGPTFDHLHLASGQLGFPATQVPSADPNTLDDYEEGEWTPTDQSGGGLSFTIHGIPTYTKIGRLCICQGSITYPSTANSSDAKISLPFVTANISYASYGGFFSTHNLGSSISLQVSVNQAVVSFNDLNGTALTNANLSTRGLRFVIIFITA